MAVRNLLHKSHKYRFKKWIEKKGAIFYEPKMWEVLRFRLDGRVYVFYEKLSCDHLTFAGSHEKLVREYIKTRRNYDGEY